MRCRNYGVGSYLLSYGFSLEPGVAVSGVAERLVARLAATAHAHPLALRYVVLFAVFVCDGYGADNAQWTVLSNLDIDACHMNSSVITVILDSSELYVSYHEWDVSFPPLVRGVKLTGGVSGAP